MAFELKDVVPWGRNLAEYIAMFKLSNEDLKRRIISFGDGPASFNYEMNLVGKRCISLDPIYQFTTDELKDRFNAVRLEVMEQVKSNQDNFTWSTIKDPDHLETLRVQSMTDFLSDFEKGKIENRYIPHSLPEKTDFKDKTFDLGLSSHFLLLYADLGLEFHVESIKEMLRVCKEIRIFPVLNLNAEKPEILEQIISYFEPNFSIAFEKVSYEFQKGGNEMLTINSKK